MNRIIAFILLVIISALPQSYEVASGQGSIGLYILFSSDRSGTSQIYKMDIDGTNVQSLTTYGPYGRYNAGAVYSPAADRILFVSQEDFNFPSQLSAMNSEGLNITSLTSDHSTKGFGDWSPSGNEIVFSSNVSGSVDIYVVAADGSNLTRLTSSSAVDSSPRWSPDGSKIVFTSNRDGNTQGASEIYIMNSDGSNQSRLTFSQANKITPAWSPDGNKIIFSSGEVSAGYNLYIMDADGSNLLQLTQDTNKNFEPDWSPDGTRIVFSSNRDGNFEIYIINSDGSNPTRLTNNSSYDGIPRWYVTLPPTPTPQPDFIFADGFDTGNLVEWAYTGLTNSDVKTTASLHGSYGLSVGASTIFVGNNPPPPPTLRYVFDNSPNQEQLYRARFLFNPCTTISSRIFETTSDTNVVSVIIETQRISSNNYRLRAGVFDDQGGVSYTDYSNLQAPGTNIIEIAWEAATAVGMNNGKLTLWVNETQLPTLTGIDNDTHEVDQVKMGFISPISTGVGLSYFDAFASGRYSYLGSPGQLKNATCGGTFPPGPGLD